MKTLDEKAAEYAAGVVAEFPELASYKGTIETIYGQGAMECELLGEETGTFGQALESLKRGHLVTRKDGTVRVCSYSCVLKIVYQRKRLLIMLNHFPNHSKMDSQQLWRFGN